MSIKRFLASSLLSVAVLFSMAAAGSATTYAYAGNPFTATSGSLAGATSFTHFVTLSITLPANQNNFDALPYVTDFQMRDGVRVFNEDTQIIYNTNFLFHVGTDGTGNIVQWNWYFIAGFNNYMASCNNTGGAITGCPDGQASDQAYSEALGGGAASVFEPGVFTVIIVPEPGSAALVGLGLLALSARKRSET